MAKSGLAKKVHTVFWTGDIVAWYKLCRQERFVFLLRVFFGCDTLGISFRKISGQYDYDRRFSVQTGKEGYYGKSTYAAGNDFSSGSSGIYAEAHRAHWTAGTKKPERSCYLCDSALQHSSCIYEQSCGGQTIVLSGGPSDLCRDSDFLRVLWKADLQEGTRGEK